MKAAKFSLLFGALFVLAGCSTALATPSPAPSPQPLRIQADAIFEPLYGLISACAPAGTAIYYTRSPEPADARLGWAELTEPAASTYTLGEQAVVLVVNPKSDLQNLSTEQIHAVYAGLNQAEDALTPWSYPDQDITASIFQEVFNLKPPFSDRIHTAPDAKALRSAVAQDVQAIGFLPAWWVDSSVKPVALEAGEVALLSRPILAGTASEPQEALRAWLVCLQEDLKAR
jgi:hypothetical protein